MQLLQVNVMPRSGCTAAYRFIQLGRERLDGGNYCSSLHRRQIDVVISIIKCDDVQLRMFSIKESAYCIHKPGEGKPEAMLELL